MLRAITPRPEASTSVNGAALPYNPESAHQHVGMGKSQRSRVTADHLKGAFEFAAIIAVPRPPKRAQKLMCVGLQNGGAGSSHLSPFAPQIAGGANLIKTTMWLWERLQLRERELPCCLFGSIHIHHHPLLTETIPQATWRGERLAGHEIFLEERPQCLHRHGIKRGKKA